MDVDWVRRICLGLAGATEQMQWGEDLVFKVGGKLFAVMPLGDPRPGTPFLSLKVSEAEFADLVEREGIRPAAYLARAHWVSLESAESLEPAELRRRLQEAHALVLAKLSKAAQKQIGEGAAAAGRRRRK